MNRNWAQIFVGAAALTGAFFFGSVMQRRHGDLDKKTSAQPMLENEDLVWQGTPPLASEEEASHPQPMVAAGESVSESERQTGAATSAEQSTNAKSDLAAPKTSIEDGVARKVVQPDFSRWGNGADTDSPGLTPNQSAPMLPAGKLPALLDQPVQPNGPMNPLVSRETTPPLALDSEPTPEHDPWTAPLSSVLLKPPATKSEEANSSAPLESENFHPQPQSASAPMLPTTATPAGINTNTLSGVDSLVAVTQQGKRKVEIDTDSFRIHVVRAGDTLQSLALKYYGKPDFYLDIYLANQDQLTSPINLPAGKALKIPDYSK